MYKVHMHPPMELSEDEGLDWLQELDKYAEVKFGTYYGYHLHPNSYELTYSSWVGTYDFSNEYDSKQFRAYAENC